MNNMYLLEEAQQYLHLGGSSQGKIDLMYAHADAYPAR
jgi:hypothetical protein